MSLTQWGFSYNHTDRAKFSTDTANAGTEKTHIVTCAMLAMSGHATSFLKTLLSPCYRSKKYKSEKFREDNKLTKVTQL